MVHHDLSSLEIILDVTDMEPRVKLFQNWFNYKACESQEPFSG